MYLARKREKGSHFRYIIRHSYHDGKCYRSRDLFDLGRDPSRFIVYPGGNSFYIDTKVEDAICAKGIPVDQSDLEPIFFPYLLPHIRRVIDGFDRKRRADPSSIACMSADTFHPFDRFRLQFLKMGHVKAGDLECVPDRFYRNLQHKSRDEIEHDFIKAEYILKPFEKARYTYEIFQLRTYFTKSFARSHPEGLDRCQMDRFFIKALCGLNGDDRFWQGSGQESGLRQHLIRYAIMYFDHSFPVRDPFRQFIEDFRNRYRVYRPPKSVQVSLEASARLFGVSVEQLKRMDCRALARQYRKRALHHHPDRGGDPETFLKLRAAYEKLRRRKAGT